RTLSDPTAGLRLAAPPENFAWGPKAPARAVLLVFLRFVLAERRQHQLLLIAAPPTLSGPARYASRICAHQRSERRQPPEYVSARLLHTRPDSWICIGWKGCCP